MRVGRSDTANVLSPDLAADDALGQLMARRGLGQEGGIEQVKLRSAPGAGAPTRGPCDLCRSG
jgi:hypothetical protein